MKDKSEITCFGNERIVARQSAGDSVTEIVQKAKKKGWTSINLQGDLELRRAVWLEASMCGISVSGYQPSQADKVLLENLRKQRKGNFEGVAVRADEITEDYSKRVIPSLKKQYDDVRERRRKAGIATTELDRAYGLNAPSSTYARELDDKFFRVKGALARALDDLQLFSRLGRRELRVTQTFEDGVGRFMPADRAAIVSQRKRVVRRHGQE